MWFTLVTWFQTTRTATGWNAKLLVWFFSKIYSIILAIIFVISGFFSPLLFLARLSRFISMMFPLAERGKISTLLLPGPKLSKVKSNTQITVGFYTHPVDIQLMSTINHYEHLLPTDELFTVFLVWFWPGCTNADTKRSEMPRITPPVSPSPSLLTLIDLPCGPTPDTSCKNKYVSCWPAWWCKHKGRDTIIHVMYGTTSTIDAEKLFATVCREQIRKGDGGIIM